MIDIKIGTALLTAFLGYAVVFLGIVLLMLVIYLMGSIMKNSAKEELAVKQNKTVIADGINPKKVAAIMAVINEIQETGNGVK